jgi:two-component system, NtrC family, sensor kinase
MKLVAKYTLVLVAALAVALSALTVYRMARDRDHAEADMASDHRVVGHVLQAYADDLWRNHPGDGLERIARMIRRANEPGGPTSFEWIVGPAALLETGGLEDHDFVSRFPVHDGERVAGTILVRESLDDTDRLVHHGELISVISVGIVVALSFAASLVLGRWLVGKPIHQLVEMARRVGNRDFSGSVELRRTDELGELASAMNAMSAELAQALAQISVETEARIRAVEHMRHADRLSTVGKLAAGVAHELGTPLSIVGGHAQMIAEREVTGDAALDSARAIDREATRMSRIVRELLDFARRRGPQGSTSDTPAVLERCVALLAPMATKAGVKTELAVAPVRAVIDDDSLQQVVTNLVVNAVQAMPTGGTLRISVARVAAAPPDAADAATAPCVKITVADTGPGIAEAARAHIFEPFFTTKQPGDGTGLGLAVVYGIVVDHRGWITVDSSPRGTSFSIFLQEATT